MQFNLKKQVGQFVGIFVVFALALFVPAGTVAWPVGWIYLALFFSFYVGVTLWLMKHNPGLAEERMNLRTSDQQGWDKVLFPVLMIFPFVWLAFTALDAARFHWSPVPLWLQVVGGVILLGSFYILFITFRENSYLAVVVRLQEERGHSVISTGPYHYVRHPMYAALLVFVIGTALLLGAWLGVLVGLILIALLMMRITLEERTLRQELPGYTAYTAQVKYRLIPFVW